MQLNKYEGGGDEIKDIIVNSKSFFSKVPDFDSMTIPFTKKGQIQLKNGGCTMRTPGNNKYYFWGYSLIARFARRAHAVPIPTNTKYFLLGILL
jgi:hypothetical protein